MKLRAGVVLIASILLASLATPFLGLFWGIGSFITMGVEVAFYKSFFKAEHERLRRRDLTIFLTINFIKSLIYCAAGVMLFIQGSPEAIFAGVVFIGGAVVNLTLTNQAGRIFYIVSTGPLIATALIISSIFSFQTNHLAPLVTTSLFMGMVFQAYFDRRKVIRELRQTSNDAERDKARAEEALTAKSRFLAKMSHELRTPLNGIIGMADVMRQGDLPQQQRDQLDIILGSGDTLLWLLNDILDHAKIEANHFALENDDEDIRDIIAQATMLYRPGAIKKGIALSYDVEGVKTPFLYVDGRRLRQCLTHLISNGVKFTESGAVLVKARAYEVSSDHESTQPGPTLVATSVAGADADLATNFDDTGRPADAPANGDALENEGVSPEDEAAKPELLKAIIEITVSDTGIGMSQDQVNRIFDAFEQADNSITRRFGGTGLGLSVSQAVIRAMGGEITVTSELGVGSTFTLRTPAEISAPPDEDELELIDPKMPSSGGKVLVVEDNIVNRKVVSALLKEHRIEITEAENGEIALTKIAEDDFDLVLMDIHMPVMDGLTATKNIRAANQAWSKIPIVALTAAVAPEDKAACMSAGMEEVLAKPVRSGDIGDVLERYIWEKDSKSANTQKSRGIGHGIGKSDTRKTA